MAQLEAYLLDAYQTILHTDFGPYAEELPRLAGVPGEVLFSAWTRVAPLVTVGKITVPQAYADVLEMAGIVPRPELERELADKARELLLKAGKLYDDVLTFLRQARADGIKLAVVSNCDENTRDLLGELGITPLVDALALSCEVHAAKPDPEIYRAALDELGVRPEAALFVDDNARFCAGAVELGIAAVRITRDHELPPAPGLTTIRSLTEIEPLLARLAAEGS
jgi:putative hydrolase of the HAD superfamily